MQRMCRFYGVLYSFVRNLRSSSTWFYAAPVHEGITFRVVFPLCMLVYRRWTVNHLQMHCDIDKFAQSGR